MMDEAKKTFDEVMAEMRDCAATKINGRTITEHTMVPQSIVLQWADELEAAHKRELTSRRILRVEVEGDKMRMRVALETICGLVKSFADDACECVECARNRQIFELARVALDGPVPRAFDEAAFDEAASRPNGWSEVPDPVAEVRRMRGDTPQGDAALIVEAVNANGAWREERRRLQLAAASAEAAFSNADARLTLLERCYCEVYADRDRLRDLVRRLRDEYEQMEERDTVCNTDRCRRIEVLFREALGEEVEE